MYLKTDVQQNIEGTVQTAIPKLVYLYMEFGNTYYELVKTKANVLLILLGA